MKCFDFVNFQFILSLALVIFMTDLVQAMDDTGCTSNRHCVEKTGSCYIEFDKDIGMCGCKNGLSNYPACVTHKPNNNTKICDEDCAQKDGYCSAEGVCMCSFGGLWPSSCCRGLCPLGQTCYKGICECMYGELPDGDCTRCKDPCGVLSECNESRRNAKCECKYGGDWPDCKEDEVDCSVCGQGSTCIKDKSDRIACTGCGPGRKLVKSRCLYPGVWQEWSACSVSCGVGLQTRKQICRKRPCVRRRAQNRECRLRDCFGEWEPWNDWGVCSRTCGTGYQKRSRECLNPEGCGAGSLEDTRECHLKKCSAELYGDWGPWSGCKQCGIGVSTKKRSCLSDIACKESLSEERPCAACVPWGQWSTCSSSCGNGRQQRIRTCPSTDGCGSEKTQDSRTCQIRQCPSKIGNWGQWSECYECNKGVQTRKRSCISAPTVPCRENLSAQRSCVGQPCAQDCSKSHVSHLINSAETLRWEWKHPDSIRNRLRLTCRGGCIRIVEATMRCHGSRQNVLDYVIKACGGRTNCYFNPIPGNFGNPSCREFQVSIAVKCVGGTADFTGLRQAERILTNGDLMLNNVQYRCIKRAVDWGWAVQECRSQGSNWMLATPRDIYTIERLRDLCNLRRVPDPNSRNWWHVPHHGGWERYTYWIGAERRGTGWARYVSGRRHLDSTLFYPGEPSNNGQECIQANGKLDNEHCAKKRVFVCQMMMGGWSD